MKNEIIKRKKEELDEYKNIKKNAKKKIEKHMLILFIVGLVVLLVYFVGMKLVESNEDIEAKIVGEKYQEVSKHRERKPVSSEELAKREYQMKLTESIITKNRVEKILYKMVMDGELRQDWDEQDMKNIAKIIPSKVYEDCQKEEPEIVSQIENFGKMCSSVTMKYCREILNNR